MEQALNAPWTRRHDKPGEVFIPMAPRIVYPQGLSDLIALCRDRPSGQRLKAVGSHWALSEAAVSDHTFVETHDPNEQHPAMGSTLLEVVPGCLHPDLVERMRREDFASTHGTFVHIEAGKRVYQLYAELDEVDPLTDKRTLGGMIQERDGATHFAGPWAFRTLGGAGGQTVVGALSTGTHGGDFDRPPIADSVVAIHLVADGGRHYWIEATGQRRVHPQLTDDDRLRALYDTAEFGGPDNFSIIRQADNAMFNAVLVSAGRFGVIYSIVLSAEPQYSLIERRRLYRWNDVKGHIKNLNSPLYADHGPMPQGTRPRFLQIVVCLTPTTNFSENLVGVTNRWQVPADKAPQGRAQRVGNRGTYSNLIGAPRYSLAGRAFPYSSDPDNPLQGEEPSLLDRACANGSFVQGVLIEATKEIEDLAHSDGVVLGAGLAEIFVPGSGLGFLLTREVWDWLLSILRELIEGFDGNDRLGHHMENVKNALLDPNETDPAKRAAGLLAWQLIAMLIFDQMQGDLDFGALSYAVMDRKNYLDKSCEHNVDSIEVFFDATSDDLVVFVDSLIAHEIEQEGRGLAFLGYVSLRFTQPTAALIGMQTHPVTCAIEVAGLKDMSGSKELVAFAMQQALDRNHGAILHWGQGNDATREDVETAFGGNTANPSPRLTRWRQALADITDNGRLDGFSSEFSRRTGLEP